MIFRLICLVLGACFTTSVAAAEKPRRLTRPIVVAGVLETGLMAIGGETTGTTLTSHGRIYELDFSSKPDMEEIASGLNGREVVVTGPLRLVRGVEVKERWIIAVQKIGPAPKPEQKAEPGTVGIDVQTTGETARVELRSNGEKLQVEIHDARGIGSAILVRRGKEWPRQIHITLNLKGLESFEVSNGVQTLQWSVPSSGPFSFRQNLQESPGNPSRELKIGEAWFCSVQREPNSQQHENSSSERPAVSYQLTPPARLTESNPGELTLKWIDFYR